MQMTVRGGIPAGQMMVPTPSLGASHGPRARPESPEQSAGGAGKHRVGKHRVGKHRGGGARARRLRIGVGPVGDIERPPPPDSAIAMTRCRSSGPLYPGLFIQIGSEGCLRLKAPQIQAAKHDLPAALDARMSEAL